MTGRKYFTAKNAIIHFKKDIKLAIKPFLIPENKLYKIKLINKISITVILSLKNNKYFPLFIVKNI